MLARLRSIPGSAGRRDPAEWLVLVPFGVFCFVFPWAMLLMSLDLMPFGMEWMSSLLLAMLGVSSGGWLWLNFGGTGAALGAAIFALGIVLEYIGVDTGLPFGRYVYTGVLVPGLPGGVPLAIGFAWLFIIASSLFTARWLLSGQPGTPAVRHAFVRLVPVLGALLAVGLDLLLEPVAFHVKNYWQWLDAGSGSGYYGVPWGNFAAWFAAALLMNLLLAPFLRSGHLRRPWLPVTLFAMNTALFGVVNAAHGIWVPGILSLVLLGAIYRTWTARRRVTPRS